jgi:hypothetical protein
MVAKENPLPNRFAEGFSVSQNLSKQDPIQRRRTILNALVFQKFK